MKQKEVTGCSLFQEQRLKRISCQRLIKIGKKQKQVQKDQKVTFLTQHFQNVVVESIVAIFIFQKYF